MEERVGVRIDRVRLCEWLMLIAALALLVDLIAFPWYSIRSEFATGLGQLGRVTTYHPGQVFHVLTPLAIVCVMVAIIAWAAQASFRGPAVSVCLTVLAFILDLVLAIGLFIRVVFAQPSIPDIGLNGANTIKPDVASVTGLILSVILLFATWTSLRTDGVAAADSARRIETLRLAPRRG